MQTRLYLKAHPLVGLLSFCKDVITEVTKTPAQAFEEANAGISGSVVNLNGTPLTATELNSTFEALGVTDGATVNLNSIVKADGARR